MKNLPVGLTCQTVFGGHEITRQNGADIGLDDFAHVLRREVLVGVLMREHDLRRLDRLAVLIAQRDLALGVGAEALLLAAVTGLGEVFQNLMGVIERRRHQLRGFAHGVAEHDALVARALVLVAGGVDALSDVGRLRVQQHLDLGVLPVKAVLLVADRLDRLAGDVLDMLEGHMRPAHLAGDDDAVRRAERLGGDADGVRIDAGLRALAKEGVHDLIGNAVANLVRMALGNGFAGKHIGLARHVNPPSASNFFHPAVCRGECPLPA